MFCIKLQVLAPHTQWGDKLFIWTSQSPSPVELCTTSTTFPIWSKYSYECSTTFDCKCYILRGDEKIWESFVGNRQINLGTSQELTLKFNTLHWACLVCEDIFTNEPVMCNNSHALHRECFDSYLHTELGKNNVNFTCIDCQSDILFNTWHDHIPETMKLRYEKVKRIKNGENCIECPNAQCNYSTFDANISESVINCPLCQVTWCKFCEKQLPEGVGSCFVCTEGLKSVFEDIYDAIEEAAGTMCPSCKYRGQKMLEECTHITCECGVLFCYCCGVSKDDVDTADPDAEDVNRLYGHNEEWESNKDTRCPMWLSDFSMMYKNWPDDPGKSQKRFHEIKAQKKLEQVKTKTPEWNWNRIMELDKGLNMQVDKFLQKQHVEY